MGRINASYLVVMGGSNEYDGTITRDIERASWANLAEESVDGGGPYEEEGLIG
jgi:hypothetical protein